MYIKILSLISFLTFGACIAETEPTIIVITEEDGGVEEVVIEDEGIPPLKARISSDFSDECVAAIMEAETWLLNAVGLSEVIDNIFVYEISNDVSIDNIEWRDIIFVPYTGEEGFSAFTDGLPDSAGRVYRGRIRIKDNEIACTRNNVAHELGHIFSVSHNDDPDYLMYRQSAGGTLLSDAEKTTLRRNILKNYVP